MCSSVTYLGTLRGRASATTKADHQLSDGYTWVIILGNGYRT